MTDMVEAAARAMEKLAEKRAESKVDCPWQI
jgi:hypothetical protein